MNENPQNKISDRVKKERVISLNKRAFKDYEVLNKYEAGLVLLGTEVKSLRNHQVNIKDAYGKLTSDGVWLINSNIPVYKFGNLNNHEPLRERKLLLNKSEIRKIKLKLQDKGFTLIPLKLFFSGSKAKLEIGLGRGKKLYDKRETIKKEEINRRLKKIKQSY
jgi:SsrA-binding protein